MDFISEFLDFTKEQESPTSFWRWAAYACVAAVLRDNVWYEHGIRQTFPNIYVVLLADSAEYRKSGPFSLIYDLLISKEISNTKVIRGRTSKEAILDELSQDIGNKATGMPVRGGSCALLAEELANFFIDDPRLIPMVTDLYDTRKEFKYNLRSGSLIIKNLCVTMLAASNETFLKEVYTNSAVYGGLLGRTFMVKPSETRPPNSQIGKVDPTKFNREPLLKKLAEVKKLKGEVQMTADAEKTYDDWYKELYFSYKKHPDRSGVTQRIHTGALKLGIILAASQGQLEIDKSTIEEAITQVTSLRANYEMYAMSIGKSDESKVGALLIDAIMANGGTLGRNAFLMKYWQEVGDVAVLDRIVTTLETAGFLQQVPNGHQMAYGLTAKAKEKFRK